MFHKGRIALRKRAVIASLSLSLIIASLFLLAGASPPQKTAAGPSSPGSKNAAAGHNPPPLHYQRRDDTASTRQATAGINPLAGITVVIFNGGRQFPLAIKVGDRYIELPGPSSWPQGADDGKPDADDARFLAAIIDTAGVLKAYGFKPDASFSFVAGGTELNAGNTYRIAGTRRVHAAGDKHEDYAVEYRTQAGEEGIWRSLRFKNIVVSHGQIPSLSDYLVTPQNLAAKNAMGGGANPHAPAASGQQEARASADTARGALFRNRDIPQVLPLEEPTAQTNRKYLDALNSADPTVRADALQNLVINGYRGSDVKETGVNPGTALDQAAPDKSSNTADKTLDAADQLDAAPPQETLSNIALHDKSPAVRIQALDQLVERFGQQAAPTLQEAIKDPDPRVARMAGQLMSDFSDNAQ